jgi:hypothetical protein
MAFRSFTDSSGQDWQVYEVIPPSDERRRYDRRSTSDEAAPDRREIDDRRLSVGRLSRLTAVPEGWLVFERAEERRRLKPIPEDWLKSSAEELEGLCKSARPARPTHLTAEQLGARKR